MTIDMLPDDVIIEIFRFFVDHNAGWRRLVQVCQRWRNLVFGSPLHLGVKLHCAARTSLREMLDVWPALPISIKQQSCSRLSQVEHENLFAILELHRRVCEIDLMEDLNEFLKEVGQKMQKPFPVLTKLFLTSSSPSLLVLPNSFLGGSTPRLRELELKHISFPALPDLLLSTTNLRYLCLRSIPSSMYIPSQVMVTCLSVMTKLQVLAIKFDSSRFQHSQTSLPSPSLTCTVLPALTFLRFRGRCNYLEDLVASINAPLLKAMFITFFEEYAYNTPQLYKFISCTNQLRSPRRVDVVFSGQTIRVELYRQTDPVSDPFLMLEVLYQDSDRRLSSLAKLSHSSLASLSTVERLDIRHGKFDPFTRPHKIEKAEWLELLRRFVCVKDLHVAGLFQLSVMSALAAFTRNGVTVLPALQNIFLAELLPFGPLQDAVDQSIAARQLSVHNWNRWHEISEESNRRPRAYLPQS